MIELLNYKQVKRILDVFVALLFILILAPLLMFVYFGCLLATRSNGLFLQERVGYMNEIFVVYKFKSMTDSESNKDFLTSSSDKRITTFGALIRRLKIDELPQLINVLNGSMSFVGPRPDVIGYAENLSSELYYLDKVKPGITSPASIFFRNEEVILGLVDDKVEFYEKVIWPMKARMNRDYADNMTFFGDLTCLIKTIGISKSSNFNFDHL